jgi:hypothetical protein
LVFSAKPGQINLKVTDAVFFDPTQTDVVTVSGEKVAFKCTAQTLSFTAAAGTSYFLEIVHGGATAESVGELQEDCASPVTLATLSAANTFARYKITVA